MCGNCTRRKGATRALESGPLRWSDATALDDFVREHVPVALDLERELEEQSRLGARATGSCAEAADDSAKTRGARRHAGARPDAEESLLVRKILACAARMQGRFGKGMLASTLRGSRARNVLQAGLDQLSTYGILDDMTQDELMIYIDALVAGRCLQCHGRRISDRLSFTRSAAIDARARRCRARAAAKPP